MFAAKNALMQTFMYQIYLPVSYIFSVTTRLKSRVCLPKYITSVYSILFELLKKVTTLYNHVFKIDCSICSQYFFFFYKFQANRKNSQNIFGTWWPPFTQERILIFPKIKEKSSIKIVWFCSVWTCTTLLASRTLKSSKCLAVNSKNCVIR